MSTTTRSSMTAYMFTFIVFAILFVPGCISESGNTSSQADEISHSTMLSTDNGTPSVSPANSEESESAILSLSDSAPVSVSTVKPTEAEAGSIVLLPSPDREGSLSVEKALEMRRSIREYLDAPLSLSDIGQILWSAQGITDDLRGFRTAPSAGALYPAEIYVVAGNVEGLESGVYRYVPVTHTIIQIKQGDVRALLHDAALRQDAVKNAPACFVITGIYDRTTVRYGERGRMYVHFEIGHIGQNIALQVVALDLGTVVIGAFENDRVRNVLGLPSDEELFYLMPCGKPVQNLS